MLVNQATNSSIIIGWALSGLLLQCNRSTSLWSFGCSSRMSSSIMPVKTTSPGRACLLVRIRQRRPTASGLRGLRSLSPRTNYGRSRLSQNFKLIMRLLVHQKAPTALPCGVGLSRKGWHKSEEIGHSSCPRAVLFFYVTFFFVLLSFLSM